jgi:(R,R)-butanediol dehydrogenase/meso-butanediol dehydrogenase/diacetyl reductase
MRGIVYHGPQDLRFDTDVPTAKISHPSEILIDIHYCGICGTDLKEYTSEIPNFFEPENGPNKITGLKAPLCMGHEIAGVVVEIGSSVKSVALAIMSLLIHRFTVLI